MQTVSNRDNFHEMSNPVFWENKKNIFNLLSAEFAQRTVKFSLNKSILLLIIIITIIIIIIIICQKVCLFFITA